jgi:hypothetical protein
MGVILLTVSLFSTSLLGSGFVLIAHEQGLEEPVLESNLSPYTSFLPHVPLKTSFNEESAVLKWPNIICDSNDNVYVTWEKNTIRDNYGNSDEIFLQKFSSNGTAFGSRILLVNRSDISNSTIALSHSTLKIDSTDNFHLFWYVMEYTSPQIGHVYYKKFDTNFDLLVDYMIIVTYQQAGWGTSAFNDMITTVIVDEHDFLHLLCCEEYYIYLDNNGTVIDSINLRESSTFHSPSLTVDSTGNIFIVWEEDYRRILFRRLWIENKTITSVVSRTLDSREYVLNPIILMREDELFVSWHYVPDFDYENSQTIYRQLNYLGETISYEQFGFNNPGVDFISRNKSLIYTIHPVGYSCAREDLKFYYSLRSFKGDILIQKREILIIPCNPESDHGPAVFSLNGFEDSIGYLWLAWYINDYTYGFQVLLWKLDSNFSSVFPITVVTPRIREYEGALFNTTTTTIINTTSETTHVSTSRETSSNFTSTLSTTIYPSNPSTVTTSTNTSVPTSSSDEPFSSGFDFLPLFLVIAIVSLVICRKRSREVRN